MCEGVVRAAGQAVGRTVGVVRAARDGVVRAAAVEL